MSESNGSAMGWTAALGLLLIGIGAVLCGYYLGTYLPELIDAINHLADSISEHARAMEARP